MNPMTPIRLRTVVVPFVVTFAAVLLAMIATARADIDGDPITDAGDWWSSGALAAPLAAAVFGLLVLVERIGATRWPWTAWLRRGSVRAWVSLAAGNLGAMLPAIATGSVTWGGVSIAVLGGLLAVRPGGGEVKPATEDVPS